MTYKSGFLSALGLALAAFLAQGSTALAAETVRFGTDFNVLGAQIWVAKEKGFFEKHGVDAQVRSFALGVDTIDATLTGQLDFGIALDFPTTTRLQSGQLKIVSAIIQPEAGFHKLAVGEAIRQPSDLAGKSIGIANATAQHLVTLNYLKNIGVTDAKLVPLPSLLEIVASLRAGRIDAAFVWGDGVGQAQSIPGFHILTDDKPAKVGLKGYLNTTNAFAKEHPQAIENTLAALIEATGWIEANFDQAVDIVASHAKAPRENVAAQMKMQHYTISLTAEQLEGFNRIAAFAADNGITKTRIEPATFIDPAFLRKVDASRVTLP